MPYTNYQNAPLQGPQFGGQPVQPAYGSAAPQNTAPPTLPYQGNATNPFAPSIFNADPNLLAQLQQYFGNNQMFDAAMGDQALAGAMANYQTGQANQQYGFDMRGLDLQRQGLGIEQGGLSRQLPLLNQQWGLQQQQYGLQQQGFDQAQQEAQQGAARQTRGENSTETARGAWGSVGHNQGLSDIQQQLQNSLSTIGRQRQSASLSEQSAGLSHEEQVAKLQDSQKQLDLMGKRMGLSSDEISARLQSALNQIGLNQVSSSDFASELAKMQAGEYSPFSSIIGDMYAFSGIPLFGDQQQGATSG